MEKKSIKTFYQKSLTRQILIYLRKFLQRISNKDFYGVLYLSGDVALAHNGVKENYVRALEYKSAWTRNPHKHVSWQDEDEDSYHISVEDL